MLPAAMLCLAGSAQAADDGSLTWNGITLSGVVDMNIVHVTHGAPVSQDLFTAVPYLVVPYSNKSVTAVGSSGLSQSRLVLKGLESLDDEFSFTFYLEIDFNPHSGKLADGPASLVANNGVPLAQAKTAADASRAGQLFSGPAYAGIASKSYGTLTLGRNSTLGVDVVGKYDPMNAGYGLSIIGFSGVAAGFGDTENARLDESVRYTYKHDIFHLGALYQFGKNDGSPGEAWNLGAGIDYGPFSADVAYAVKKDALALASLTAAQLTAGLPHDSLRATVSDNEGWQLAASYALAPWKFYGGYEHINYSNPSLPLSPGFSGLGGYWISAVNNAAFPHDKVLEINWLGAKYDINKKLDLTGAWYRYNQHSYGPVHCSNASTATCSGSLNVYSVRLVYHINKRFDLYTGAAHSKVADGLSAGYLHTSTWDPMVGLRFQF